MISSARNHYSTKPQNLLPSLRSFPFLWVFVGLLLTSIFWFYLWTATQGLPIPWTSRLPDDRYNRLTDAILAGQLSLLEPPHPVLLALPDPYDPEKNGLVRLHDASLYRGMYYLYFGVTPVLLLFLPFRILSAGEIPESVAAPLFFFGALLASLSVWQLIWNQHSRKSPLFFIFFPLMAFALTSAVPFTLRRPAVYEVAIGCGYFCFMMSSYFFLSWHSKGGGSAVRLFLGSLFLGLAVGARPTWVLGIPLVILTSFFLWRQTTRTDLGHRIFLWIALWGPLLLVLFLLGLYNYLRFDSWFEFGMNYQLAGFHPKKVSQFYLHSFWPGLYFYLWQPLVFSPAFPFVHVLPNYPGNLPPTYIAPGSVAGLRALAPFVWIIPLAFTVKLLGLIRKSRGPEMEALGWNPNPWICFLLGIGIFQIAILSFKPGAMMRYAVDFAPLFILAASFFWLTLYHQWAGRPFVRKFLALFGILTILYGCSANIAISFTGYYDNFKKSNPTGYQAVKEFLQGPILRLASIATRSDFILVEIENRNGLEKAPDGIPFFWMGQGETAITVFSKQKRTLLLRGEFHPGPSIPETSIRRILLKTNQGFEKHVTIYGAGEQLLSFPVDAGSNLIFLSCLDSPTRLLGNDPRPLLLMVRGLAVKALFY